MSIRNDLRELNGEGKLQRKHGGAEIPHPASLEIPLSEREKSHYREKEWIGKAASTLVFNGDSIMIDAGTTTERIARHLEDFADLTVITNGINILSLLMRYPHINLYTIEGRVDHRSFSIVGQDAERTLSKYHARISFISVDGFTIDHGLMNDSFEATNISRILVENSQRRVLLVDSSKIGKVGMSLLGPATLVDTVITDSGIPEEYHSALRDLGLEVMIADEIIGARQLPSLSRE
jgi:DeoR family transcriptional regulator of aga operon